MAEQKKKSVPQGKMKKDAKPWEKMNAGKEGGSQVAKKSKENVGKNQTAKKAAPVYLDFLYLLPKKSSVRAMASELTFIEKKNLEVWEEEGVLEIATPGGTITFEDIRDSLEKEDEKILSALRMKQVFACDYSSEDVETVKKCMETFLNKFGGKIGTDTEDFTPFVTVEELGK